MLLTLEWMDNLQQIECYQRTCHLFFIFNLTCYKFVPLKENTLTHCFENHYSKQTKHPLEFFLWGDQDVTLSQRTKSLNFSLLLDITSTKKLGALVPPLIKDHTLERRSLIAFRPIPKILPAVYIFSNTIMTNLKELIGSKSLYTKQCPARLSPRIIPLNFCEKPWGWGRIPAGNQKCTHFPHQKNPP